MLCTGILVALTGCLDEARKALPFVPQSKFVNRGGRMLTRNEVAYYQKLKDLLNATKINPRDAEAFTSLGWMYQRKGYYSLAKELYYKAISIDDTLSEPHHNLGVIYITEDRYNGALDELKKARTLSPDDARIRHRLGQTKVGLGKLDEALKEFDEAVALDPEFTPAYLEKAKLLYTLRRYAESAGVCRQALAHVPKEVANVAKESRGHVLDRLFPTAKDEDEAPKTYGAEAAYDLALCLKAQGQIPEALSTLVQAEKTLPAKADVQILKARLLEAQGDTQGALSTLQPLRLAFPNMAEVPKRMARLYQKNGDTELAFKTRLEAAELDHSDRALQEEAARNAEQNHDVAGSIAIYERLVRVDPDGVEYRRKLAKAYDVAGIQREAALAYQEIVNRTPEDYAIRRRLGILYSELPGFEGRAIIQFKQVLERNPRDVEAYRRLGELYLKSKNLNEAEKYIKQTLIYSPQDAVATQNLAALLGLQNRLEESVDKYKEALSLDPKLYPAQLNMAKTLVRLNRLEDAISPLRIYIKAKPLDEEAHGMLAAALRDMGRREESIKEFEAIQALKPGNADASLQLASLENGLGKPQLAAGVYESILEKQPSNTDALREAGRLYGEMKMPLRAVYCWQRFLALNPGDLEAQTRLAAAYQQIGNQDAALKKYEDVGMTGNADAWRNVAYIRLKRNEKEQAIKAFREIIKLKNTDVEARRNLAGMLLQSPKIEDKDEALKLYQEILQLDGTDNSARLNLANLLAEENRLSEAQEQYEAIVRDNPGHTAALVGLGVIYRKRRNFDKAIETYHLALKADPKLMVAHYNMALIYDYYLNDRAKAQVHYDRYIELGGDRAKLPDDNPDKQRREMHVQPGGKEMSSK